MTKEEKCLWLASANAAPYVSDDAIRTKEDAAAAIYYRRSISSEASDPWFAPRLHRLRTRPTRRPRYDGPRCAPSHPSPLACPTSASPLPSP